SFQGQFGQRRGTARQQLSRPLHNVLRISDKRPRFIDKFLRRLASVPVQHVVLYGKRLRELDRKMVHSLPQFKPMADGRVKTYSEGSILGLTGTLHLRPLTAQTVRRFVNASSAFPCSKLVSRP